MLVKSKLKYIQTLGQKKFRQEEGMFIAEGPKIVTELLASKQAVIEAIYALPEWIAQHNEQSGQVHVVEITTQELEKISQLNTPNQVLAVVKQFDPPFISTKNKITLVLDTIQDPGNMGTIIRIADWFGVDQVVCSNDSADLYNPKVVQATMGSIARVKVLYTDLERWLKQQDVRIYAALLDGQDISSMKKITEGIFLIGNESRGISNELIKMDHVAVTIPKKGKAESLNAAVATGILLSHLIP